MYVGVGLVVGAGAGVGDCGTLGTGVGAAVWMLGPVR
jgi:hypothetical protein